MRFQVVLCCLVFIAIALSAAGGEEASGGITMDWKELPPLPQSMGGQFVGTHNGALIVAGGTDWDGYFLEDGTKSWLAKTYVLPPDAEALVEATPLPEPRAYGATVSTPAGMYCIGGSEGEKNTTSVTRLTWDEGKLTQTDLPALPVACAMCCAAAVGDTLYVTGGMESPKATEALNALWVLDLAAETPAWEEREPLPGPGRILAVGTSQRGSFHDGAFYVFSGASLKAGPDGAAQRTYLTDGYFYTERNGWETTKALPRAAVAAPVVAYGEAHILVFTGDDGALVDQIKTLGREHPGFPRDVLAFHTITDTWTTMGEIPESLVTSGATLWNDRIVVAGGEPKPGFRSARVLSGVTVHGRKGFGMLDYAAVSLYFIALVGMGIYFSKRESSTEDFFLGGQRVPWWAAGISIYGTLLSAISFLAVPATSFRTNWLYAVGSMVSLFVAPVVIYLYLPFFRETKITTAYEYLEKRFNAAVRLFGSLAFVIFQLGRMGIVLFLPALALTAVTGIDIYMAVLVMGVLCTFYTVLGGIEAVIWTDVIQVVVLLGGAWLALIIMGTSVDGGFAGLISTAQAQDKFHMVNWGWDFRAPSALSVVWVLVIGRYLEFLIPYTTDQTVIQRYLTTPSLKAAQKSVWTGAICSLPSFFVFFGIGTALYVFYQGRPELLDPTLDTDQIFPLFIVQQLPAGISGLVIAAVFAAAMSSLDSSMNSVSAVIVTDFYRRFSGNVSDKSALFAARIITIALGVLGTATALWMAGRGNAGGMLWEQYMKIIALFGGSLGGIFALGIFTKRGNGPGAIVGALACVVVLYVVKAHTGVSFLLHAGIGIVTGFVVGYAASLAVAAIWGESTKDLTGLSLMTRRKD